jgi:hypothetical protein
MTSSKQNTTTVRTQAPFMPLSCNSVLEDAGFDEVVTNILSVSPYLPNEEYRGVQYSFTRS